MKNPFRSMFILFFCVVVFSGSAFSADKRRFGNNNNHKKLEKHQEENSCAICLTEFESDDKSITLSCEGVNKHTFHVDCLKKWAKQWSICPLCKRDLIDDELKKLCVVRVSKPKANDQRLAEDYIDDGPYNYPIEGSLSVLMVSTLIFILGIGVGLSLKTIQYN